MPPCVIVLSGYADLPEYLPMQFLCVQAVLFPLPWSAFHGGQIDVTFELRSQPKRRLCRPDVLSHIAPHDEIENQHGSARWVLPRNSSDDHDSVVQSRSQI